jgi:glycoprotein-N-acetylgalactosamine 3-beta-galactosyltransferase
LFRLTPKPNHLTLHPSTGTVHIPHEGPEEYGNIWQKVRSTWSYVYDNYYDQYDFFHIGGDDLYILVENLRLYLESDEITLAANGGVSLPTGNETSAYPLFLGRRFAEQGKMNRIFNSGGAGYTLNKAALKALVVDAFPVCFPHLRTFAEDVMVAECLREHVQVFPYDTKDDQGGERYMPFTPAHHLTYRLPAEADRKDSSDWYVHYSIDIKEGLDHCAADAVTFHYIDKDLMRRMHAVLYGHCS